MEAKEWKKKIIAAFYLTVQTYFTHKKCQKEKSQNCDIGT